MHGGPFRKKSSRRTGRLLLDAPRAHPWMILRNHHESVKIIQILKDFSAQEMGEHSVPT
jgi:hypothetical protein